MIDRSTARSLMTRIFGDDNHDNELKKAYFLGHPLHDEAIDTMWGLNWFANGHPQDRAGKPLPLDRLGPDDQREARKSLTALYPLRHEIDKHQGMALPWDNLAGDGAHAEELARQKYRQSVDPLYSTALHEPNHPAHDLARDHFNAWQDWRFAQAPVAAPTWNGDAGFNSYDRKAIDPLRNPWAGPALSLDQPGAHGASSRIHAHEPINSLTADGDAESDGAAMLGSAAIRTALERLFATNVSRRLGLDPSVPNALDPNDVDSTNSTNVGTIKLAQSNAERDGTSKFLRIKGDEENQEVVDQDGPTKISPLGEVQDVRNLPNPRFWGARGDTGFEDESRRRGYNPTKVRLLFDLVYATPEQLPFLQERIDLVFGGDVYSPRGTLYTMAKANAARSADDPHRFDVIDANHSYARANIFTPTSVERNAMPPPIGRGIAPNTDPQLDSKTTDPTRLALRRQFLAKMGLAGEDDAANAGIRSDVLEWVVDMALSKPGDESEITRRYIGLVRDGQIKHGLMFHPDMRRTAMVVDDIGRRPIDDPMRFERAASFLDLVQPTNKHLEALNDFLGDAIFAGTGGLGGRKPFARSPSRPRTFDNPATKVEGSRAATIGDPPANAPRLPIGAPGRGKSLPFMTVMLESLPDTAAWPEMINTVKRYSRRYSKIGAGPLGENLLDAALHDRAYTELGFQILKAPKVSLSDGNISEPDRIVLKPDGSRQPVGRGLRILDTNGKFYLLDYGSIEGVIEGKIGRGDLTKRQLILLADMERDGFGHLFRIHRQAYKDIPDDVIVNAIKAGFPNGKMPEPFDEQKLANIIARHKPYLTSIMLFALGNAIVRGEIEEF